jgi:GT2 family glycosyltransferase
MAIVLLTHNGVGLGHLRRGLLVAEALEIAGERPVLYHQGPFPDFATRRPPSKSIPPLYRLGSAGRQRIVDEMASVAALTAPAFVVEDSHVQDLLLPQMVGRALIVRPNTFGEMSALGQRHEYSLLLIADAPGSPTWPYDEAQTRALLAGGRWRVLGPIHEFRHETSAVRSRLAIGAAERVCIFSMGGGGQHRRRTDAPEFLARAEALAVALRTIDPSCRLLFVRGPLFPRDMRVPAIFEAYDEEAEMPALLAVARGAFVRPGFNTVWECLAAGTPFTPVLGTWHQEAMEERLASLHRRALAVDDLAEHWLDDEWHERYRRICKLQVEPWSCRIDGVALVEWLHEAALPVAPPPLRRSPAVPAPDLASDVPDDLPPSGARLAIRIDDVTELDAPLRELLAELVDLRLPASLEVIPYLARLDEDDLLSLDPDASLFEVSQHGWAHLPRHGAGSKAEFSMGGPSHEDLRDLERGMRRLAQAFPRRFRCGFSAPFDGLPEWLPPVWADLGGKFVSWIWSRPRRPTIALAHVSADPWNWSEGGPRPLRQWWTPLVRAMRRRGRGVIVIHPRHLCDSRLRRSLGVALRRLQGAGARAVPLSAVAATQAEAVVGAGGSRTVVTLDPWLASDPTQTWRNGLVDLLERLVTDRSSRLFGELVLRFELRDTTRRRLTEILDLCGEFAATPEVVAGVALRASLVEELDKELFARGFDEQPMAALLAQYRPDPAPSTPARRSLIFGDASPVGVTQIRRAIARAWPRDEIVVDADGCDVHGLRMELSGAAARHVTVTVAARPPEQLIDARDGETLRASCDSALGSGAGHLLLRVGPALRGAWDALARRLRTGRFSSLAIEVPFWIDDAPTSVLEWVPIIDQARASAAGAGWEFRGGRCDVRSLGLVVGNQYPDRWLVDQRVSGPVALSILAPVYNRERELPSFFGSLALCRSSERIEIIVVDDGSSDGSRRVLQDLCARLPLAIDYRILALRREGVHLQGEFTFRAGVARQEALGMARGTRIVFVDPDQELDAECLEQHLRWGRRGFDVVLGVRHYRDTTDRLDRALRRHQSRARHLGAFQSYRRWWSSFFTGNASVSRSAIDRVGGFDVTLQCWGVEDIDLGYRLQRAGATFWQTPRALVTHLPTPSAGGDRVASRERNTWLAMEVLYRKYLDRAILEAYRFLWDDVGRIAQEDEPLLDA